MGQPVKHTISIPPTLTLREGVSFFRQGYQEHLSHTLETLPQEAIDFFEAHDVAHVLFGCDISLFGEGAVKIWTIFGTSLGFWKHLKAYKAADALGLSKHFTFKEVVKHSFKLLAAIPVIIVRARRMTALWPWSDFEAYLDSPIANIRKEFNIQVLS